MAELIAGMLEATGCELAFVESLPGRPSLAAVLPGIAERPRVLEELRSVAAEGIDPARGLEVEVEQIHNMFEPCEIPADSPLVRTALAVVEAATGRREDPYGTP
ncbi:MAG: hypothetical protein JO039_14505 [Solirubrobacterales bacterium]|nr:hypothetical protein [Solirubrobacterales bacterium]